MYCYYSYRHLSFFRKLPDHASAPSLKRGRHTTRTHVRSRGGTERGGRLPLSRLISVVDDDDSVREAIRGLLKSVGYAVETFPSGEAFLASQMAPMTACLIADVQMSGMTGVQLHAELVAQGDSIPTILITAYPDDRVRARALSAGVIGYLSKPFENELLLEKVRGTLEREKTR